MENVSPFDPVWHGVGWGDEEEDGDHAYEEEPLNLDDMNKAAATARLMAIQHWYNEHRASPADLQGVPPGLLQMVVPAV